MLPAPRGKGGGPAVHDERRRWAYNAPPRWGAVDAVTIAGHRFPLYSARRADCDAPVGLVAGKRLCQASANNVLWLLDAAEALPGWRPVGARPRWNAVGPDAEGAVWRRNQASLQRMGELRWMGARHHVRIWHAGDHAIGQAHYEDWVGALRRRHRVLSLDAGRDAVVDAARDAGCQVSFEDVPSVGQGFDGRVAVIQRSTGRGAAGSED